jgi:alpha-beta hydrolase superfamily lysophospholipase
VPSFATRRSWLGGAVVVAAFVCSDAAAQTRVSLLTIDGISISGTYFEPSRRPAAAVLLVHMPTRSRNDWATVAPRFAARGVGALAIDLRGHGDSSSVPLDPGNLLQDTRDLQVAIAWLKQRPEVIPGRIGILGASLGANLAVVVGGEDPSIHAIALLSVTLDFRGVRTEAAMRKFGSRPVLMMASEEDAYASRSTRQLAGAGTGTRDVRLVQGAGHGTVMLTRQPELVDAVVDWLSAQLL